MGSILALTAAWCRGMEEFAQLGQMRMPVFRHAKALPCHASYSR